ncbi:MAG: chromosome segregation protein SMC [Gemmatimonadaceae bacterium]
MRLTKLELHGFKSFADHTELVFEPGATAIVGPNGCGKSNVSDAVRWVLGEQRARALRGAKMEEVIFQGSSARRPVNIAEVSLHFENNDGALDIPFREVVITRRLSRSGDSDYFINRAPARLRDIQDMVRGTGLGADSGVVIESRMIDALLSDRPDDRRELFEEAAGVGLYRDRKRSTERRLEETTLDLARIGDLLNEKETHVRSLARQRKRAERHAELTSRRFAVEVTLAAREMAAWGAELEVLRDRLVQLRETAPSDTDRVGEAEGARDVAHAARSTAEAGRGELARLVAEQRERAQQLRGEIAVADERRKNAASHRERAQEESRERGDTAQRVEAELTDAAAARAQLEGELASLSAQLRERAVSEESARAALSAARSSVEQAERRARELREQAHRLTLDRDAAERERQDVVRRHETIKSEQLQLFDAAETVAREVEDVKIALDHARVRVVETADLREVADATARAARAAEAVARTDTLRAEEAHAALEGRSHALEALERERVGLAPAAARLLKERDRFGDGAVLGPLSDYISAGSAPAALIERYLGATVHAVLVRDGAVANAVRAWHATTNPGPLLLLPLDAVSAAATPSDNLSDLAALVRATEPSAVGWVRVLLGQVRAVEEGTAFIDARGAVWLPATVAGPGPLRRRAELTDVRRELNVAASILRQAAAVAAASRESLDDATRSAATATDVAASAAREARLAEERVGEIVRRHQRATREVSEADAALAKLTTRGDALGARASELDAKIAHANEAAQMHAATILDARRLLSEAERTHDETREQRTAAQVEQAQAQARLQVVSDRERRLRQEQTTAASRLAALHAELSTLSDSDAALTSQLADWALDLEARDGVLHDAEAQLADAERAVRAADEAMSQTDHELDRVRREVAAGSEQLHATELRYTELSGRQTAIRERLQTDWRRPLEELLAEHSDLEEADDVLRADAVELRTQLEALGQVNPLAIEEHQEESKHVEFLRQQRADLDGAKAKLQQAIKEIDNTARELFLQTFGQVRENFRHIFMTLFGGGDCDLRLENPSAPLDGDIEVHASPRGKKTQRIHLLSSGERALVALSLLFGIFLMKPSPFCLLDEVDAPLDDQNIGRFVRMLNEFKKNTQFIVITHNPRTTTEAADAVYGVTMQEPGVSSIVSVRLRERAVEEAIEGSTALEPATASV